MDSANPRRRVPRVLRERLYQRSHGICERDGCQTAIDLETFHVSHLRAHASGGALVEENLEAWCSRCNLTQGARDVRDTRLAPREWQLEALDPVVARIISDGAATVSAAPGAGKTVFAGLVFATLRDADVVDRVVILAPRRALVDQWAKALRATRHLELKPHGEIERQGQDGVVVTYQSLTLDALDIHRREASRSRTLLVLDEVHHVGEPINGMRPAWARNVAELAGEVDRGLHVTGVLNLSGTLWRSARGERISTVRYRATGDGRLESLVDYDVPAERLIQAGELRPIDIYRLDARVQLSDMAQLDVVDSNMADLDERPARATLGALGDSAQWRTAFVRAILDRLEHAHRSLDGHHVKALIVAARQSDARSFQDEVNRQMHSRGLRPLAEVATSDEDDPARVLEEFRRSTRVGVLCTVDMAGEGYDCPDIAVVGYATNKLTTLYVRQVVARAMRVTDVERRLGRIIPAALVVPDVAVLIETLVGYLAPFAHEILLPQETAAPEGEAGDETSEPAMVPLARYLLDQVVPGHETVTVSDDGQAETFDGDVVRRLADALEALNVPPVYAPRMLLASRRTVGDLLETRPFDSLQRDAAALDQLSTPAANDNVAPQQRYDSIEDRSRLLQKQLNRLEGWWAHNGDSPIGTFAGEANRSAGIALRGGRPSATPAQLERAVAYERRMIAAYCQRKGLALPRTQHRAEGGESA
jgi:superfamily II DNA or RNA helicase